MTTAQQTATEKPTSILFDEVTIARWVAIQDGCVMVAPCKTRNDLMDELRRNGVVAAMCEISTHPVRYRIEVLSD